jgi:TRAP-type C4-dicarboxylate transport system substrate-binding protein
VVICGGRVYPKLFIKIATLAPKNSSLASVFEKSDQEIRELTHNEVGFRTYYGGIQGDEKEVIQKIQFKQLHGGAFTVAGLYRIVPEVHILSLPYLYRNYEEVEYVRNALEAELSKLFMDKGYVAAAWGATGFVYEFSNVPITSPDIAKKQKYWQWGDDPVQAALYKALGVTPVSLSITDVMTSLSTRLIDAASATPGIAVAFRWYTKFKYMSEYPTTCVQGAILIRKEIWDKISPENQKTMKSFSQKYYNEYVITMKRDDGKAAELLKKAGIQVVRSSSSTEAFRNHIAKEVQEALVGKVYSRELLNRVLSLLEEYRKNHPASEVVKLK